LVSAHDREGAVFRARIESLQAGDRPFPSFWPPGSSHDGEATRAATAAFEAACRLLRRPTLAPLLGWHRLLFLDFSEDRRDTEPGLEASPKPPRDQGLGSLDGASLGAALALMLISRWHQLPLPQDRIVTGSVDLEGRLTLPQASKESILIKAEAIVRERGSVKLLIVPQGLVPESHGLPLEILPCPTLAELCKLFELDEPLQQNSTDPSDPQLAPFQSTAGAQLTLDAFLAAVEELGWLSSRRQVKVDILRARAERLAHVWPDLISQNASPQDPPVPWALQRAYESLLLTLCQARLQSGDLDAAATLLSELAGAAQLEPTQGQSPDHLHRARTLNALASLQIELDSLDAAKSSATQAIAYASLAAHPLEAARAQSTLGRVLAAKAQGDQAISCLEAAIAAFETLAPWESNIAVCTLIGVVSRQGDTPRARELLRQAREDNLARAGQSAGWHLQNRLYLSAEALALELHEAERGRETLSSANLGEEENARELLAAAPHVLWPHALILLRLMRLNALQGRQAVLEQDAHHLLRLCESHPGEISRRLLDQADALLLLCWLEGRFQPAQSRLSLLLAGAQRFAALRTKRQPSAMAGAELAAQLSTLSAQAKRSSARPTAALDQAALSHALRRALKPII